MNNEKDILDLIRFVADFAIVPLCVILWDVQKRLSTMEGTLKMLVKQED